MGTSICAGEASFCGGSPNSGLTLIIAQARLVKPAPPITQQVWEGSEWKSKCEKQSVSLQRFVVFQWPAFSFDNTPIIDGAIHHVCHRHRSKC